MKKTITITKEDYEFLQECKKLPKFYDKYLKPMENKMEWKKISESEVPFDTPICVGAVINTIGLGKKFLWYAGIVDEDGLLTDAWGKELEWDLKDYTHFCILPKFPTGE